VERRYTTEDLLACERQIVDGAARRADEQSGVLPAELVERVLSKWQPTLNADQAAAVRQLAGGGCGVEAITALAGSGKTTLIGALAACYRAAGWEVVGAAPTGRAPRQLRDTAAIPAETMHTLLLHLASSHRLSARTILVLDEAGMAPTRLSARLLAAADDAGAKVIAVGDPGQLGSVQAGGWLAAITTNEGQPALRVAVRQCDPSERDALHALHDGDPATYLAHKHDHITVHEREAAAVATLTKQWSSGRRENGLAAAVMIARDNYTRELINRCARAQLKLEGALAPRGVFLGGREYAPSDRVIACRNHRRHDIDNGTLATVLHINERTGAMVVMTDTGRLRALDPHYVAEQLQHGYALTAHAAQGATFQWVGVIGRPQEFTREWA
jgi:ATP-dependent exoDNAse (exonuclease V) alpha subunit